MLDRLGEFRLKIMLKLTSNSLVITATEDSDKEISVFNIWLLPNLMLGTGRGSI